MTTTKCRCGQPMRLTYTETIKNMFVHDEVQITCHYICDHCGNERTKRRSIDTSQLPLQIPLKDTFD